MARTATDIHHSFAGNLAYEDKILWDAYTSQQFELFRKKIDQFYKGPTPEEVDKATQKTREAIYKSTIAQTKYTNKNLLASFILVTVAEAKSSHEAANAEKMSIHLIIRTRKCIKNDDSTGCCMIFIDEFGKVYKNWTHFMETNSLPPGIALAPLNGVYNFKGNELVLDTWATPASGAASMAAAVGDVTASVGGLAAAAGGTLAGITGAAVLAPAIPIMGAVALTSGAYTAIRSAWNLYDRKDHEQSVSLTDSTARGSWLGVASGTFAISASVATKCLANLAMAGKEISATREFFVNGMNISTLILSGTGTANGILDLILKKSDGEDISNLDVLQIAASLIIFTHSAYNFRLASTLISQSQDMKVNAYRQELSNRQRKMFDKMTKETIRTKGAPQGKMDLIRLINEVPDNQYLNDLNKVNKDLNKNNVRFSAGQNGQISLNDEIQVIAADLRSSVQHNIGENILGKVNQPIPTNHQTIPNQEFVNILSESAFADNSANLINYCQIAMSIASSGILNPDTFQDCVRNLVKKEGGQFAAFLIRKAKEFIELYGRRIESLLKTKLYLEGVLWELYQKCKNKALSIDEKELQKKIEAIFEELLSFYENMSFERPSDTKIQCDICKGFYQICDINI